jgi:tetratricopeptide (TPR) repeat protein
MTLGTDHNGVRFFDWPVHEGRDLSWLKNYERSASIFAVDCVFDFFGAYDVDADRGVVQVADHYELSGKKAWTWGTWDFGLVSQKNLTDEDGPYIEVQSGPLPTQSDYGMLLPRQEVAWREWWYPVHGLKDGFEYATKDLAVQTVRRANQLELRLLATGKFPGASCVVSQAGKQLLSERLDLSPATARVVTVAPDPKAPADVTVRKRDGSVLASFVSPLPIPEVSPPPRSQVLSRPEAELTLHEKFLRARKHDLATNRKRASEFYQKVLDEDPGHAPALRGLAVLDIEAARYERAAERLYAALERDPDDGLAWYFLGVSYLRMGKPEETLRCARQAVRYDRSAALAYDLVGRALARRGKYDAAVQAFGKATLGNPLDAKAREHLLLAVYASGATGVAPRGKTGLRPTALVPRALLALRGSQEMSRFAVAYGDLVGGDDFEMLEVSLVFAELGLWKEAGELLRGVCVQGVPKDQRGPLPLYYLAYFLSKQDETAAAREYLEQAAETYRDYVFPSRPEALPILRYAVQENPTDAYAHLHIGNLYAHLGRLDEAAAHWRKAAGLNASLSIAHRNLGLCAWAAEDDLRKAEKHYRAAIKARPEDQTLHRDLAEILLAQDRRSDAICVLEATPFERLRRADVIIMLAQAYVDEQRYTDAIDLLESTPYFVNWEGQTITWDLFHKSHMERGRRRFADEDFEAALRDFEAALTYPENIGVGRSNRPQEAAAQYWRGRALQALGRLDEARSAWEQGAAGVEGAAEQNEHRKLCSEALRDTQ